MTTLTREQVVQLAEQAGFLNVQDHLYCLNQFLDLARADLEATIEELQQQVDFWQKDRQELQQKDDAIIAEQAAELEQLRKNLLTAYGESEELSRENASLNEAMATLVKEHENLLHELDLSNQRLVGEENANHLNKGVIDLLRQKAPVPEGWKLVPAKPTEEMELRGAESTKNIDWSDAPDDSPNELAVSVYTAMIEAAPDHQ